MDSVQELEAKLGQAEDPRQRVELMNELAIQLRHSDSERALALTREAHRLALASDCPKGIAESLFTEADVFEKLEKFGEAIPRSNG